MVNVLRSGRGGNQKHKSKSQDKRAVQTRALREQFKGKDLMKLGPAKSVRKEGCIRCR